MAIRLALAEHTRTWSNVHLGPSLALVRDEWWRSRALSSVFAVLLHALACVYYASVAALHEYIRHHPRATGMINLVGRDVLEYFDYVVGASIALVVVHGLGVCAIAWFALPTRQFVETLVRWDRMLEHRCGVDSYELLVLVEIGLQTYQANKLSHLVSTIWINRLTVLVLVMNCWFMPAMTVVFRKRTPTFVKIVQLALDALLEIVYGMVVPLAIFYPYYRDAMRIFYDNPFIKYYDDTWSINTVAENRQIYVTSWVDFCSKMAPGVSLFVRLYALRTQRNEHEVRTKTLSLIKITPDSARATAHRTSVLYSKRFLVALMVLWGLGVLVLHLAAASVGMSGSDLSSCLLETRPFGSTQYACTVLEVSCTQKKIRGSKAELDYELSNVDPLRVKGLVFSHCEALEMPPRLKSFPILVSIKIHNCTIAEWGDDAALTGWDHPALQILYVTLTNMTAIPPGLLSRDFPPLLRDIEMCGTNLTGLPVDLFDTWSKLNYFALELSPGITEFPPALLRTNATVPWITLSSNSITALPDNIFTLRKYRLFHVAGNPLTRLPALVGNASLIPRLSIAHTNVSEIPATWTANDTYAQHESAAIKSRFVLTANHSPLCAHAVVSVSNVSTGSATLSTIEPRISWVQLQCTRNSAPYYYPLAYEQQLRTVNRG